ncbi:hypothetical protein CDD81_6626 [Ophiocordyceps australis]|uniref:FAD-binding PCMH-type domain-containing protein n=1 Tax=Ophiocordyceps australis TaxID=1399860 RepID=A0A2C5Y575_9HYPO|nr:hypothetical protein CDD81_6626 [Ophiocordyceps australis]
MDNKTGSHNEQILQLLTSALGNDSNRILQPGSDAYTKNNGSYFSAFENELQPAYIAKPTTAEQVASLVKALGPRLVAGTCRIAIRGQGHAPFAGSANIDGECCVTIDMRGLEGIRLSDHENMVKIGVGETWESTYTEIEKYGKTTPGGRVGGVGVAGFILGVVEFEVVLASGQVVCANKHDRCDLWTALKGGLNNFGIVTSISIKTIEATDIWGGITYYTPEASLRFLQHACDFCL